MVGMSPKEYVYKAKKVIEQRNMASVVVFLVLLSNISLAWKLLGENDRVILIPQNDTTRRIVFDGKSVPDDYLADWASSILSDLYTVNRHTVESKNKIFLNFASSAEQLKDLVKKNADRIQKDGVSTVYYPKQFKVDQANKKVLVQGTFMAHYGRDKAPIIDDKSYAIGWITTATGCLLVESLEEIPNEDF
jgi:type IV conjugative transfer system protein TraE